MEFRDYPTTHVASKGLVVGRYMGSATGGAPWDAGSYMSMNRDEALRRLAI